MKFGLIYPDQRVERGRAANPTTRSGFIRIETSLARLLKRQAGPAQAASLRRIAKHLASPPGDIGAIDAYALTLREQVLGMAAPTAEAVDSAVAATTGSVYRRTRTAMRQRVGLGGIGASFQAADHRAVSFLRKQHTFYVRNSFGAISQRASGTARNLTARGLREGLGTKQIGKILEQKILVRLRQKGYMETLASLFVNRSRTASQLNGYSELGIERFMFSATMDERTTDICRFLDGKIFSVGQAKAKIQEAGRLPEPEDVKFALPFIREFVDKEGEQMLGILAPSGRMRVVAEVVQTGLGKVDAPGQYKPKMSDERLEDLGVGPPPAHFRCRSDTVPVF